MVCAGSCGDVSCAVIGGRGWRVEGEGICRFVKAAGVRLVGRRAQLREGNTRRARISLLGVKQASEEATTLSWQGRRGPGDQQRQCMDKRGIKKSRIASVGIEGG